MREKERGRENQKDKLKIKNKLTKKKKVNKNKIFNKKKYDISAKITCNSQRWGSGYCWITGSGSGVTEGLDPDCNQ